MNHNEASKHIQATLTAFGPGEAINLTQDTWANLHAAMTALVEQPEQEPVAWHHPECTGECLACLIERVVQQSFGPHGVDFLRKKVTATTPERKPLTDESIAPFRRLLEGKGIYLSDETTKALVEAAHGITGETK